MVDLIDMTLCRMCQSFELSDDQEVVTRYEIWHPYNSIR